MLQQFLQGVDELYLLVSGENITVQGYLASQSIEKLSAFVGVNRLLIIDEAQKVPNIGANLKLILIIYLRLG
jgi:uncharacterized protein